MSVPQLRLLATGFSSERSRFNPRIAYMRFVLKKVALNQVVSKHFGFPLPISIPYSSITRDWYKRPQYQGTQSHPTATAKKN
jgi:hypothetical protein